MERYKTPIYKTSIFGERMAAFCSPAGNKLLCSSENRLVVTWWPRSTQSVFPLSIANGHSSRKLLTSFLRPEYLRLHVGTVDAIAQAHMDTEWAGKGQLKAAYVVKSYTFAFACRLFASIGDPDHISRLEGELEAVSSGVLRVPVKLPGTRYYRALRAAERVRRELAWVIRGRGRRVDLEEEMVSPARDLLSYLLMTGEMEG